MDRKDTVATVILNRPEKRNALTLSMLTDLEGWLLELAADDGVRVIVLRGAGASFCVGADVSQFASHDANSARRTWIAVGHRVSGILAGLPQPTIAVIQGHAFGGGLELALACDFRLVGCAARLGLPEVGLGTLPGWGGTGRLAAAVGPVRAKEMVLLSTIVDGGAAARIGLATAARAEDELEILVDETVATLVGQPPIAVQLAKQVMGASLAASHQLQTYEALAGALSVSTADLQEGVRAFAEKRQPQFQGK